MSELDEKVQIRVFWENFYAFFLIKFLVKIYYGLLIEINLL